MKTKKTFFDFIKKVYNKNIVKHLCTGECPPHVKDEKITTGRVINQPISTKIITPSDWIFRPVDCLGSPLITTIDISDKGNDNTIVIKVDNGCYSISNKGCKFERGDIATEWVSSPEKKYRRSKIKGISNEQIKHIENLKNLKK